MNYSIYVESTPNPKVMKFVSNRMLADKSLEFLTENDAKKIPMIYKIFSLPFVESIFLSTNFISIAKINSVEWEDITLELRNFITRILNEDEIKNYSENIEIVKKPKPDSSTTKKEKIENVLINSLGSLLAREYHIYDVQGQCPPSTG